MGLVATLKEITSILGRVPLTMDECPCFFLFPRHAARIPISNSNHGDTIQRAGIASSGRKRVQEYLLYKGATLEVRVLSRDLDDRNLFLPSEETFLLMCYLGISVIVFQCLYLLKERNVIFLHNK